MNWFVVNPEIKADSLSQLVLVDRCKIHINRCIVGLTCDLCEHKPLQVVGCADVKNGNARTHAEKLFGQLHTHVCMQGYGQ